MGLFWGDGNVLELVVMAAQSYEYDKSHKWHTLKWGILSYVNSISIISLSFSIKNKKKKT